MLRFFTLLAGLCFIINGDAQQYQPVNDKSTVKFTIKNFGINTGGNFKGLAGTIDFDKDHPEKGNFTMSLDAATVNTDNDSRDSHLRKAEYFDVANHPKITFTSEKVSGKGNNLTATGKLTIKGVSKNISIPFTATAKDDGYVFEGSFQINRRDFKVGGNGVVLGDNVNISLSVFAQKK